MTEDKKPKVFVAMSGGVDSSVSAALLKNAGFDAVGVYMRQWSPEILGKECLWKNERQDAMKVAAKIGIPFQIWDFSKEYEKEVGKYMIDSYKKGITPNPDVVCNRTIKFGLFFDRAIKEGADFVATGHYAMTFGVSLADITFSAPRASLRGTLVLEKVTSARSNRILPRLLRAVDQNKDQTYFLYDIKKEKLSKIISPIGNLTKPQVRILAKKFGLHNAQKKDSQGVCFIGKFDMKQFLKMHIKPKKGKILSFANNKIVGEHDGVYYYTIGQRHGLDIKDGKGPYFVVKKDIKKNIIYVGSEKDLYSKESKIENINWLNEPKKFPVLVDARTRYRASLGRAVLFKNGKIVFKKPQRAITPGQSTVFYRGNELIGGGTIDTGF